MNARGDTQVLERAATTSDLTLSLAIAEYDRTRAIIDGRAKPEGIKLDVDCAWIGDFCHFPVYERYDIAEMSFSWYVAARLRGEPVIALPIFPLRMAVHGYFFVRADSPIQSPAELVGKRIASTGYRYTVNLWLRGIMKDIYGVSPEQLKWFTNEKEGAGFEVERLSYDDISLLPLMLPVRLWHRLNKVDGKIVPGEDEMNIPIAPVNAALTALVSLEALALRAINMPIGCSLMCLARKPL